MVRGSVLTGLAVIAWAGSVLAQQPTAAQQNAIKQNCRADFQAHCAGVAPGGSAALSCLQQNASAVSAPCQQALSALGGGSSAQAPAPGTAPGTGGTPATPPGNAPSPQSAPPPPPLSPRQQAYILRQACAVDFQRYCRGVPFGGGRAIGCLMSHDSDLSPRCQGALASARR
jgi:hypothetical protein